MYQRLQRLFAGPAWAGASASTLHSAHCSSASHADAGSHERPDGDLPPSAAKAYRSLRAVDGAGLAPPPDASASAICAA